VQSSQAAVSCPDRVAAVSLEVLKELRQEGCVQLLHAQVARRYSKAVASKPQQKAEAIPVAGDRVGAGPELSKQSIREETLKK
jgi:hypothetical protein